EEDPRMVFLVPWTRDIPIDLAGRFARDGRVIRIGRESRLRRLFGVGEVDVEALKSPLPEWLRDDFGVDTDGGLALDALLAWAALDGRARQFVEGAGQSPQLRSALLDV